MAISTTSTDTWDMVLVHKSFRRDFRMLPALVRAVPDGDTARSEIVGFHVDVVARALHHHHTAEDDLIWPLLLERAAPQAELVHRMEAQHRRLHEPLERLTELNPRWRAQAQVPVRDELANLIAQASAALDEHLADEEREILPIVEQHLTPAEWAAVGERGKEYLPKGRLALVFLGALFEEATPAEKARFLNELPPPARLIWRLFGDRVYAGYRDRLRRG